MKTNRGGYRVVGTFLLALAFGACAERAQEGGTNTNWFSCESTSDCPATDQCVEELCVPLEPGPDQEPRPLGTAVELVPAAFGMCALTSREMVVCWRAGYPDSLRGAPELGRARRLASAGTQGYTCTIDKDGGLACKDTMASGPLIPVDSPERFRNVSVGFWGGCALSELDEMQCWGNAAISDGLVDDDLARELKRWERKPLPRPAVQVAFKEDHGCAVLDDGRVFCFGRNDYGVVDGQPNQGDALGSQPLVVTPVEFVGITDAKQVAVSMSSTCVLHETKRVSCVGETVFSGTGAVGSRAARGELALEGVTAIAASRIATCALTEAGELHCWGIGNCGTIGDVEGGCDADERTPIPVRISGFGLAKAFGLDDGQLCIVALDDTVWCRGFRWDYGIGSAVSGPTPYRVPL